MSELNLPVITGQAPVVVPAINTTSYWLSSFVVQASDINGDATLFAKLTPYYLAEDGVTKIEVKDKAVLVSYDGLFIKALTDPDIATIMGLVLAKVQAIALSLGKI